MTHFDIPLKASTQQPSRGVPKSVTSSSRPPPANPNAAREAAIKALKARREAEEARKTAKSVTPTSVSSEPGTTTLKFVIPKREVTPPAPQDSQQTSAANARKKPLMKRPAARKTASEQAEETVVQNSKKLCLPSSQFAVPPQPEDGLDEETSTLFIGDLPESFTSEDLAAYFSQFGHVKSSHVRPGMQHGFVTFATREEAEDILSFLEHQPIVVGEEQRPLRIDLARKGAGAGQAPSVEHPRVREARAEAAALADQMPHEGNEILRPGRTLVSYDDL